MGLAQSNKLKLQSSDSQFVNITNAEKQKPVAVLPTLRVTSFEQVIFSEDEIAMLRSSFEQLKRNRDVIAVQIHQRVTNDVEGAFTKYKLGFSANFSYRADDSWISQGLGMALMSGIERCLLRLGTSPNSDRTVAAIAQLTKGHKERYNVSEELMAQGLEIAESVIVEEIHKSSKHENTPDNICKDCLVWHNFFKNIRNGVLISTQQQEVSPPPPF